MAGDLNIGTLTGKIVLEDQANQKLDEMYKHLDEVEKKFDEVGKVAKSSSDTANQALDGLEQGLLRSQRRIQEGVGNWYDWKRVIKSLDGDLSSLSFGDLRAGLNNVAEAGGLTFEALGAVQSAGAAIGAGYAGWKIGRAIADFFDLDTKIGNATASLLGWGDAAGEAAAAKADTLARATEIVGYKVIDLATAIKINNDAFREQNGTIDTYADKLEIARSAAKDLTDSQKEQIAAAQALGTSQKDIANALNISQSTLRVYLEMEKEEAEAAKVAAKAKNEQTKEQEAYAKSLQNLIVVTGGVSAAVDDLDGNVVEAIKYYLDAGASVSDLARVYGLTETQINAVKSSLDKETESQKAATAANKEFTDAVDRAIAVAEGFQKTLDTIDGTVVEGAKYFIEHGASVRDVATMYGLTETQAWSLAESIRADTAAIRESNRAHQDHRGELRATQEMVHTLAGEYISLAEAKRRASSGGSITYDLGSQSGLDQYKKLNPAATFSLGDQQIMDFIRQGGTLQDLIQKGIINPYGGYGVVNGNIPSFEGGGSGDFGSGTLAWLHGKETITPMGFGGGAVNIYITSHDADHTAQVVEDHIMNKAMQVRKFGSAVR